MITKEQAMTAKKFEHVTEKDSRGNPVVCRANGKCMTLKLTPEYFKLPVKYGLKTCFYITAENAMYWNVK